MQSLSVAWLYPLILVAGALQAWGPPMNGALRQAPENPWLASLVSFLPIIAFLGVLMVCQPRPLPTAEGLAGMPWWAPLGGVVGAIAAVAGLLFVDKVGAGGAVAGCVGNSRGGLRRDDGIASGGEVNHALSGRLTEALPAIDLAHADLA